MRVSNGLMRAGNGFMRVANGLHRFRTISDKIGQAAQLPFVNTIPGAGVVATASKILGKIDDGAQIASQAIQNRGRLGMA